VSEQSCVLVKLPTWFCCFVQRESEVLKKQLKECRGEVEQLCTAQDRLKQAQTEIEILKGNNEVSNSQTFYIHFLYHVTWECWTPLRQ